MKTAPAIDTAVLLTDLTEPSTTATIARVVGYDPAADAWQVELATETPVTYSSFLSPQASPTPRTAWVRHRALRIRAQMDPGWEVYDIKAPRAATVP